MSPNTQHASSPVKAHHQLAAEQRHGRKTCRRARRWLRAILGLEKLRPWKPTSNADTVVPESQPYLLKLPTEILQSIVLYLDAPYAAALVLTCHDLKKKLGTKVFSALFIERRTAFDPPDDVSDYTIFLGLLDRDSLDFSYCHPCRKLHRPPQKTFVFDYLLDKPRCQEALHGFLYHRMYFRDPGFLFSRVHMLMKHHCAGLPTKALLADLSNQRTMQRECCSGTLDFQISDTACISRGRLLLRTEYQVLWKAKPSPSSRRLFQHWNPFAACTHTGRARQGSEVVKVVNIPRSINIPICPHYGRWNPATGYFTHVDVDNFKPAPHGMIRSCDGCPTEFTTSVRPAPHGELCLEGTVWKDFGLGQEWNDEAWWSHFEPKFRYHRRLCLASADECFRKPLRPFIASRGGLKRDFEESCSGEKKKRGGQNARFLRMGLWCEALCRGGRGQG